MGRTLQIVGALALVAWTGLGLFAWTRAADGLSITTGPTDDGGADELALLTDRVDTLSADLDSLAGALEVNFERLAQSQARALAKASTVPDRGPSVDGPIPRPPVAEEAPPLPTKTTRASPGTEVAAELQPIQSELEGERSFLSFRLPSRDFRFDGTQDFTLLRALSRVGFDAQSTLHDFSGLAEGVHGGFRLDLARPGAGVSGRIECGAANLGTGLEERDAEMHRLLGTQRFPLLVFEPKALIDVQVDAQALTLNGTLSGALTIRDQTADFALSIRAHVDEARRLVVEGQAPLSLAAFGIEAPRQLGVVRMDDEIQLWVHLFARARVR